MRVDEKITVTKIDKEVMIIDKWSWVLCLYISLQLFFSDPQRGDEMMKQVMGGNSQRKQKLHVKCQAKCGAISWTVIS